MPKYIALSEIRGLQPPKKGRHGQMIEHVIKAGEPFEAEAEDGEPLVKGGAAKLDDERPAPVAQ